MRRNELRSLQHVASFLRRNELRLYRENCFKGLNRDAPWHVFTEVDTSFRFLDLKIQGFKDLRIQRFKDLMI